MSRYFSASNITKMEQDWAIHILTKANWYRMSYDLSNVSIFNDLEWS